MASRIRAIGVLCKKLCPKYWQVYRQDTIPWKFYTNLSLDFLQVRHRIWQSCKLMTCSLVSYLSFATGFKSFGYVFCRIRSKYQAYIRLGWVQAAVHSYCSPSLTHHMLDLGFQVFFMFVEDWATVLHIQELNPLGLRIKICDYFTKPQLNNR